MSVEFSNAYQEVLLENLDAILKQNFMFQARLKLAERESGARTEIQTKYNELLSKHQELESKVGNLELLKNQAEQNNGVVNEKNRIQIALNDTMKKVSALQSSLDAVKYELEDERQLHSETKEYVAKLELIAPSSKLKKLNAVPKVEVETEELPLPEISDSQNLLKFNVDDGSTF